MRVLGIDFGLSRIGVAISDADAGMAFPLKTIHKRTREQVFEEIEAIVRQRGVSAIALGLPLDLEGRHTLSTRQAENFRRELCSRLDLPVHLVDEACTSVQAEAKLREAGVPPRKRKSLLDQQAAVEILETFLNNR
ncbi:MAG: Holliday junction resolvase RuvX [Desulfohalobiaceae bacterium]|nr:Holliday junction resolvase RuvX [Desulfohalobiaceae bacterium]